LNTALLTNSLVVGTATSVLACLLGTIAALCLLCFRARMRAFLLTAGIVTLALPPFLVVNAWLDLLGPGGLAGPMQLNVFGLPGTVFVLTLLYWPVSMLGLWMAWTRLEPSLLEAEPAARGRALVWHLLLPLGRSALAVAAVLTFVLAINNFAVPSILQTIVYPTEIWVRYNTGLSGSGALMASWPLVLAPLLLMLVVLRKGWRWPHVRPRLDPALFRRQLGAGWSLGAAGLTAALCLLSMAVPLAQVVGSAETWKSLPGVVAAGTGAVWNSFFYAATAATLCTLTALLLARLDAFPGTAGRRRTVLPVGAGETRTGASARSLVFGLSWVLFFLPGSVLGIGILNLANPHLSGELRDSAALAICTLALRHVALAWTALRMGSHALDRRLVDAARVDGATGWQLWRHAHWPQTGAYFLAGWYAVFLLCLWEVDSLVLLAPPGGDTLSMRAFNLLHYGHTSEVNGICLVLLVLAIGPFVAAYAVKLGLRLREASMNAWKPAVSGTVFCLCVSCAPGDSQGGGSFASRTFQAVEVIGARGSGPGQFSKPRSLALDSEDNLYVADMTGRVQKFAPSGAYLLGWQLPQTDLGKAKGMCRDNAGNIVVIEPHYSRVNHYSAEGALLLRWGEHGTNDGAVAFPRDACVNPDGQIFVSEYGLFERVQRFQLQPNGPPLFLNTFGSPGSGPGQFNRPEGLGLDTGGRVHVADSCNHRVQVFTGEGVLVETYGRAGKGLGQLSYPYDVCVDPAGLRFVCEFGNSRIHVFDSNGNAVETIGGPGSKPGEFNNPWSMALDSAGNLYVADSQNHRVQKLVRRK
jgi:ABC-type Fe3+ transport system permease subunit/DNA-binding beta-propeller fold protein YncE